MKKISGFLKITAVAAFLGFAVSPAYSIVDANVFGSLPKYKVEGASSSTQYAGLTFGANAHMNFSIPLVFGLGFGPYVELGKLKHETTGASDPDHIRAGLEAMAVLKMVPIISPFLRGGFGYDSMKSTGTISGQAYDLTSYGTSWHVYLGIQKSFLMLFNVFVEYGIIRGNQPFQKYTLGGVSVPFTDDLKVIGSKINFGVGFSL